MYLVGIRRACRLLWAQGLWFCVCTFLLRHFIRLDPADGGISCATEGPHTARISWSLGIDVVRDFINH